MKYFDVGVFCFKILPIAIEFIKYVGDKIKYHQYYRSNRVNLEQLSHFLIGIDCGSSKKL